ncbi:MAG: multiubiquitin domain-containing protein [Sulfurimonas sp.]|uniref:multiubiquitin domain-containing protein n=1 Tax=Sulfurimonas sp. TaxID=2022749 RepID=UPI00263012FA|nr:multiubiquitin domain-containing protein [Sulfurimonas sp.]MDD5372927.1 multiubiquitin domain-containing protein [Sulfurimonas sp.]
MSNLENNRDNIPGKEKEFTIIIGANSFIYTEKEISYEKVVELAGVPVGENTMVTVAYERGEHGKSGNLVIGELVKVKEGMFFHVEPTNRS